MYSSTLPSTSALDGGGWSTPRPGRFTPGKDPVPIVQEAGWTQGRSGRVRRISPLTGIRSPDRPARSESLYRLSYIYLWSVALMLILRLCFWGCLYLVFILRLPFGVSCTYAYYAVVSEVGSSIHAYDLYRGLYISKLC